MSTSKCQLILVLDLETREEALALLKSVGHSVTWVKIGLQMFLQYGRPFVEEVAGLGYQIFLDLKLHDIPNTVASAIKSLKGLPVGMLTIHASGGSEMLRQAKKAQEAALPNAQLLAVTVLTSIDQEILSNLGCERSVAEQVLSLATLVNDSGIQGLVCSPHEIQPLREKLGSELILVTPGIRPAGSSTDDQKRIMTPTQAAQLGSSFVVVGRPILKAENPQSAAEAIQKELQEA